MSGEQLAVTVNNHMANMRIKNGTTDWGTGFLINGLKHWSDVDVNIGKYKFDCCGFVKWMLMNSPDNISKLPLSFLGRRNNNVGKSSGHPNDWYNHWVNVRNNGVPGWTLVKNYGNIKFGDILIKNSDANGEHGHMMIAMGRLNDGLLAIADSSGTCGHKDDSRKPPAKGMGTGKIKVEGNKEGIAFKWNGIGTPNTPLYVVRLA